MSDRPSASNSSSPPKPPSPLALRALLILTLTCTFLGLEFVLESLRHGATLVLGTSRVPMYLPGGLLLALGGLNIWRWRQLADRVKDS